MLQIILVTNKHDNNVSISMIMQFPKPALNILERHMLSNVIHHQSTDGTTIVAAMLPTDQKSSAQFTNLVYQGELNYDDITPDSISHNYHFLCKYNIQQQTNHPSKLKCQQ